MILMGAHWLRRLALQHRGETELVAGAPSPITTLPSIVDDSAGRYRLELLGNQVPEPNR